MSPTPAHVRIEQLLEHAGWIRALARRLTHDAASAEDLEQRTWLAALEHPPGTEQPLRQWLAAVLRNFARQVRRGEGRRVEHERLAARREGLPSAADIVERAAVQRELVEAVLALDEPYRSAVLLRYFEGLSPRAIARELGLSVETVHTRLQRGIARLRERLDRAHGGDRSAWALALLPLAAAEPLLVPASLSPASLGTLIMNAKLKAACAALAALGLLTVWLVRGESPGTAKSIASAAPSAPLAAPERRESGAPALVESTAPTGTAAPERVAAGAPKVEPQATPAVPAAAPLRGQVLDARGSPAAEVDVGFEHESGAQEKVATSGPDGRFEISARELGSGRLVALEEKLATVLAGVTGDVANHLEPIVVVAPKSFLSGHVFDEGGGALAGVAVEVEMPAGLRTRFQHVLDRSVDVHHRAVSDPQGGFAIDEVALVEGAEVSARLDGFEPFRAALAESVGGNLSITLSRPRAQDGMLRGRVLSAAGEPVEGARIAFGVISTSSEEDGSFAFAIEDPSSMNARFRVVPTTLIAVKKGFLPAQYEAPKGGEKVLWPALVVLRLGASPLAIEGRVVGDRGEPMKDAKVWIADATFFGDAGRGDLAQVESILAGAEERFWNFVETGKDGRFRIDGLLARDYQVRAMDPRTLLRTEEGPIAAGSQQVELRLPTDALYPRVAGRIVSHSGIPIAKARVFPMCDAFQARFQGQVISTSHDALDGVLTDGDGRFEIKDVPKSLVYLRIEGEEILPLEYGRWVEGDARFEGAVQALPKDRIESLAITVDLRCHFQVELADPTAADEIAVLDKTGRELVINTFMGNGRREDVRAPILDGRSHPMAVSDAGETLVVYKTGKEVARMALGLTPGALRQVQL